MIKLIAPPRLTDQWGSGNFGAPRGKRTHQGIDYACVPHSKVLSNVFGEVTKIGYPYDPNSKKKGHLRYVQVTDKNGFDVRYFYVFPLVKVGDKIGQGGVLGESQDLATIWPGMTNHVHFEVKKNGAYLHPQKYLQDIKK